MDNQVRTEIERLHTFFQDWFRGDLSNDESEVEKFSGVLDDDFTIIVPSGAILERDQIIETVKGAHGSRPGVRIWIENPTVRSSSNGFIVATYEEWSEHDTAVAGRLSTVVFRETRGSTTSLIWMHVHETWIKPPEPR